MNSMKEAIAKVLKKLNCGVLALIMCVPCVLISIDKGLAFIASFAFYFGGFWGLLLLLPILFTVNIFAFIEVCGNDTDSGLKLTRFGGFIGGFIAANIFNREFSLRNEVNKAFIMELFIFIIYPVWIYLCM